MARFQSRVCQPADPWAPLDKPDGKVSIKVVPACGLAGTLGHSEKSGKLRKNFKNTCTLRALGD